MKTKVTSNADSSAAGSGAGIAVAVFVTNSEAFIDSNAATPVTAASLTMSADTDNAAPTTAKSSPKGARATTPGREQPDHADDDGGRCRADS